MGSIFYLQRLYPFQDLVLKQLAETETGFYLSGGTALSRGYLNHRFSDDLDFFVDDDPNFRLWADRFILTLASSSNWNCKVIQRDERYVRVDLRQIDLELKIEMINDVPSRIGKPWMHPVLGRLDTAENILANKITAAIDREAPKDLADIWALCCDHQYSIKDAITGAQGKASGVFPADLARVLMSAEHSDWELVKWVAAPDPDTCLLQLHNLGKSLIFAR